jgi:Ca2+-binding EF-hand superfamily protein
MSIRWKLVPVVATVGVAALLAPVVAQQPASEDKIRASFRSTDKDGDGYVNIDEYVAHYVVVFGSLDKNRDGFLSRDELPADHDPAQYRGADRNGDGRLSLGEMIGDRVIYFFEFDRNRDGVLSAEEVLAIERTPVRK